MNRVGGNRHRAAADRGVDHGRKQSRWGRDSKSEAKVPAAGLVWAASVGRDVKQIGSKMRAAV